MFCAAIHITMLMGVQERMKQQLVCAGGWMMFINGSISETP